MSFTKNFSQPFFTGGSTTTEVPGLYPLSLNGRPYMLDTAATDNWRDQSIPMLKQLYDPNPTPSEASLNAEGLWRRAQESWHEGAGQIYRDRDATGSPYRFRSSKGFDPWTKWQGSLLPDTAVKKTSANTNLLVVSAGARLYLADGTTLSYTTDMTSWSNATGTPGVAINGLDSDGVNVYLGVGASGIYKTDTSASAAASFVTGTVGGPVAYVKGRLMCANTNSIYNPTGAGALPAALFTHGNAGFTWVGFAEGQAAIYAAGFAGDKSLIYRIAVKPDASALDAPILAGALPDGEIVRSIGGYLGFIFLGTDKGVRFCQADAQGNLQIGPYIATANPVKCFEGQDKFVWFGWTNYDATSTGLGRLNLQTETDVDTLAYASDLMATTQGTVLSVCSFLGVRVFAVSGVGVYAEITDRVASGTIDSGLFTFGLPDAKTLMDVNIQFATLVGTLGASLAVDDGQFSTLGTATSGTSDDFNTSQSTGEVFEVRATLTRSASATTTGPTLRRYTLKALAGAHDGPNEYLIRPILLHRKMKPHTIEVTCDPAFELDAIKALRLNRTVVILAEYTRAYSGVVEDFDWIPYHQTTDPRTNSYSFPDGTCVVKFKRLS